MNLGANTLWLEHKYIGLLSYRLDQFKRVTSNSYRFRCPLCGDSQKNRLKARGYVYESDGHLVFKCHNCGESIGVSRLIERVDPELHREFRLECFKESGAERKQIEYVPDIGKFTKPRFSQCNILKSLKKISQLPLEHPAALYVRKRLIPTHYHHKLYYCPKFVTFVNHQLPGKLEERHDEPRLIIPFIDQNGYLFGFQGRSFKKNTDLRYITIMLDETKPKIFGLDTLDKSKDCYILEGPIDSMFVSNSLAFAGADGNISDYVAKERAVVIYDNEPRSPVIVKKILTTIGQGYRVVIWPDHVFAKDINDLALTGMSQPEIMEVLSNNTFSGMSAIVRLNEWKKVII